MNCVSVYKNLQVRIVHEAKYEADDIEREIPEDVAARTDKQNDFPSEMWKKLGDAG